MSCNCGTTGDRVSGITLVMPKVEMRINCDAHELKIFIFKSSLSSGIKLKQNEMKSQETRNLKKNNSVSLNCDFVRVV